MKYLCAFMSIVLVGGCPSCGAKDTAQDRQRIDRIIAEWSAVIEENRDGNEWLNKGHDPDQISAALESITSWVDSTLPKEEWPLVVQRLGPRKVYRDGPNVVLTMSLEDNVEMGFYIRMPRSSRMAPPANPKRTYKQVGMTVWSYMQTNSEQGRAADTSPVRRFQR